VDTLQLGVVVVNSVWIEAVPEPSCVSSARLRLRAWPPKEIHQPHQLAKNASSLVAKAQT
jgi:hypothetical protein